MFVTSRRDRTLESWLGRGIIPKWPYFVLVNYYKLLYPDLANEFGESGEHMRVLLKNDLDCCE